MPPSRRSVSNRFSISLVFRFIRRVYHNRQQMRTQMIDPCRFVSFFCVLTVSIGLSPFLHGTTHAVQRNGYMPSLFPLSCADHTMQHGLLPPFLYRSAGFAAQCLLKAQIRNAACRLSQCLLHSDHRALRLFTENTAAHPVKAPFPLQCALQRKNKNTAVAKTQIPAPQTTDMHTVRAQCFRTDRRKQTALNRTAAKQLSIRLRKITAEIKADTAPMRIAEIAIKKRTTDPKGYARYPIESFQCGECSEIGPADTGTGTGKELACRQTQLLYMRKLRICRQVQAMRAMFSIADIEHIDDTSPPIRTNSDDSPLNFPSRSPYDMSCRMLGVHGICKNHAQYRNGNAQACEHPIIQCIACSEGKQE